MRVIVILPALALSLLPAPAGAQSGFDGRWSVMRAADQRAGCSGQGGAFTIRIRGGNVAAPGGSGTVSASGAIRFPGVANVFTGNLAGNNGSGTFSGRCAGSFTAQRR